MRSFVSPKFILAYCFTVGLLLGGSSAESATLYFNPTGGLNNYDWNDGGANSLWATTPGGVATETMTQAGNDYIVDGNTSTASLRANTASFNGDSLTIRNGGILRINGGASRQVNLTYDNNGTGDQLVGGDNAGLNGTFSVLGDGAIYNLANTTGFTISSTMSGSGNLRFRTTNGAGGDFSFSNNATNGFTGVLTVGQTSLDRAAIDVSFAYAINSPGFTLSLIDGSTTGNGQLNLDRTLAFADVFVGGTSDSGTVEDGTADGVQIADGVYTWADLDAAGYGDYFIDNGGTLIVAVPEPSTASLLVGGALLASLLRRRRATRS